MDIYRFKCLTHEEIMHEYLHNFSFDYEIPHEEMVNLFENEIIFISGAGGTIGKHIVDKIILSRINFKQLILHDFNENSLYIIKSTYDNYYKNIIYCLGNLCDSSDLINIFMTYRPTIVLHIAAYKSVVMGANSPISFINNNVSSTINIINAFNNIEESKIFMATSTDKATNKILDYSQSKSQVEQIIMANRVSNKRYSIIRFCNILDTNGSFAIEDFKRKLINNENIYMHYILPNEINNNDNNNDIHEQLPDGALIPERYFVTKNTGVSLALHVAYLATNDVPIYSIDKNKIKTIPMIDILNNMAKIYHDDYEGWKNNHLKYIQALKGVKYIEHLPTIATGIPLNDNSNLIEINYNK